MTSWPTPIVATRVKVPIPVRRCCAPGCGDKIKPLSDEDWCWRVKFSDGTTRWLEPGCVEWLVNGHPDYGGGVGCAALFYENDAKGGSNG